MPDLPVVSRWKTISGVVMPAVALSATVLLAAGTLGKARTPPDVAVLGTDVFDCTRNEEVSVPSAVSVPTSVPFDMFDAAIDVPAEKPSTPGKSAHVLVVVSPDQSCT